MKKKTFSKILSSMLVAIMLLPNFGQIAYGAETPDFDVMNVQLEEQQGSEETEITVDGMVLSYKDAPYVDTSFADEVKSGTDPVRGAQPTSYSSSSYLPAYTSSNYMSFEQQANIVTPVKNQNPYGTCWAHAAMSVAETNYIKTYGLASDAVDFNEYQHVWYAYNPVKDELGLYGGDYNAKSSKYGYTSILDLGGNNLISMMMLANWTGASNASESVFDSDDVLYGNKPADSFAYDDIAHLENAYVLTIPNVDYYSSYADMQVDMNIVKQAIRDYGSVTVSYAYTDDYRYNSETFQCINIPNYLEDEGTNHAVTIVGWNDNVPASAFPNGADGNGAWLVKNSWDTWYGYDGYFWLSYYDRSISMNAVAMDFSSADNYDNNYHYDGGGNYLGYVGYSGYDYVYAGNAFVADSVETLEAVGLVTYDVNYDYTIYVYTDVPAGAVPTAGNLATTQSGTLTYAGVHTIDLNQSISLDAGERYGIVVCYEKPGYQVVLSTDYTSTWGWVDFYSYAKAGESYIGLSLSSMEDMNEGYNSYGDGYNVRIKAFTNEGSTTVYKGIDYAAVYSYEDYINYNPDIYNAFGTNTNAALEHFVLYGMAEGRQAKETFNVHSYKNLYPDLRSAFGNDLIKYYMHYIFGGMAEGRIATGYESTLIGRITIYDGVDYSAVYSFEDYVAYNPDVYNARGLDDVSILQHFVLDGMAEGRQGKSTFNVNSYKNLYPDLRNAFGNNLKEYYLHYVRAGKAEGRIATGYESTLVGATTVYNGVDYAAVYSYYDYVGNNPDVYGAYGLDEVAVLRHFVDHGMAEGRTSNVNFDVHSYKVRYADLQNAFGGDLKAYYMHYALYGKAEGRDGSPSATMYNRVEYADVFDAEYYLNNYGDLKAAFGNDKAKALEHFVTCGMLEGRQAKADFNVNIYKERYGDLQSAYGNDLVAYYMHYILYGKAEGRSGI